MNQPPVVSEIPRHWSMSWHGQRHWDSQMPGKSNHPQPAVSGGGGNQASVLSKGGRRHFTPPSTAATKKSTKKSEILYILSRKCQKKRKGCMTSRSICGNSIPVFSMSKSSIKTHNLGLIFMENFAINPYPLVVPNIAMAGRSPIFNGK